jgi:hypothetical protein
VIIATEIRLPDEEDLKYVVTTWTDSLRRNFGIFPRVSFWKSAHQPLNDLVRHSQVRILCSEEAPALILSWSCYFPANEKMQTRGQLHYIWTRPAFRQNRFATKLANDLVEREGQSDVSFLTHDGLWLAKALKIYSIKEMLESIIPVTLKR